MIDTIWHVNLDEVKCIYRLLRGGGGGGGVETFPWGFDPGRELPIGVSELSRHEPVFLGGGGGAFFLSAFITNSDTEFVDEFADEFKVGLGEATEGLSGSMGKGFALR